MHRTQGSDYTTEGGKRRYIDANPPSILGTTVPAEHLNAIQEEIINVIEAAGIAINNGESTDRADNWDQMKRAIFDSEALDTSAIKDSAIVADKIAIEAVKGYHIAPTSLVAPLKQSPNPESSIVLATESRHFMTSDANELMLSESAMTGIVTKQDSINLESSAFTKFEEFQFGALSIVESIGLNTRIVEAVCNTGLVFDLVEVVDFSANAKTILGPLSTYPKGWIKYGSTQNVDALTYGTTTSEKTGSVSLRKNGAGIMEAVLRIYCPYEGGSHTILGYSFKLLLAHRVII